jgi:hypothetical protein
MRRTQRLSLRQHFEEVASQSTKKITRKTRGMLQARHPLFVTTARIKSTKLKTIGTLMRYVHFVAIRKIIMRHLAGRKQATCHKPACFQRENGKKTSPIPQQTQRHLENKRRM